MKKILKWTAYVAITLVVIILVATITLPFVIDPNDYKPDIIKVVKDKTGRQLSIPGEIKLSVFPWLGLELGEMALANPPGFDESPFVKIQKADVRVDLLALLKTEVKVGELVLDGLSLNLLKTKTGETNWADLTQAQTTKPPQEAPATPEAPAAAPPIAALAVGGISINNANILWEDQSSDQRFELTAFTFSSGEIVEARPFKFGAGFGFASRQPKLEGTAKLQGKATLSLSEQNYQLDNTELGMKVKGKTLPGEQLDLTLNIDKLLAQLNKQTIALDGLALNAAGIKVRGKLAMKNSLEQPDFAGRLLLSVTEPAALGR